LIGVHNAPFFMSMA